MDSLIQYNNAVNAIKTAILQGQYEAAKGVNRIQLALYFAIGKYLSQHTRKGVWGEGALASISEQLRKELPDLRRFSETQMKDMRRFYEAWNMLDSNSAVATAELCFENSAVATAELQNSENQIDISILYLFLIFQIFLLRTSLKYHSHTTLPSLVDQKKLRHAFIIFTAL